jgi:uncharacterized protein with PQ loop repeat
MHPDSRPLDHIHPSPPGGFDKLLQAVSIVTMVMTVPQVLNVWFGSNRGGVSLLSWSTYLASACLWFVYGWQKRDKTIYLACIGWIALDAAIVVGVLFR